MRGKEKSGSSIGGVLFVGFMFVGAGIGMIFDQVAIGGAIGMGLGFIVMGLVWAVYKNHEKDSE